MRATIRVRRFAGLLGAKMRGLWWAMRRKDVAGFRPGVVVTVDRADGPDRCVVTEVEDGKIVSMEDVSNGL